MKKGIALFLTLLMALAMAACGDREPVPDPEPGAGEEPAAEEAAYGESRIAVSVPEGWEAYDSAGMLYRYQRGTASFMMKEEAYFSADTLDMIVHQARVTINGAFDDVRYVGEPESVTVGGLDASRFCFTCELGGITMKYEYVYLIIHGDVYAVTFSDLDDTFDTSADDFLAILDSIVIG